MDMSQFIIAKSDQLNADDLIGGPITITITEVRGNDSADQPVSVCFDGDDGKPFKPCKSMRRVMVAAWQLEAKKYVGRRMTLFRDPDVQFGGMKLGGIRISHMSGLKDKLVVALQVTRGKKGLYTVHPLAGETRPVAAPSNDAAAKWANAYIGKLNEFTTVEAVQNFAAQKAAKLAELETARPDLHQKVTDALATRTADLQPKTGSFDDDDFSTPSAEGNAPASEATAQSSDEAASTGNGETTSNSGPTAPTAASPSDADPHPGTAIADAIIAEINDPENNAVMDVSRVLTKHELDIAAMLDADGARVEIAADQRRNAIRKEQDAAKVEEGAE